MRATSAILEAYLTPAGGNVRATSEILESYITPGGVSMRATAIALEVYYSVVPLLYPRRQLPRSLLIR